MRDTRDHPGSTDVGLLVDDPLQADSPATDTRIAPVIAA
ncbi:hypothetical protein HNR15_000017 [Allobranchiibius huperziae]|uniref:Uncharacterized protein n=1 Tax=Allobranchiibius huperziae TaxID=1874116 RepID=A0A853DD78_9MICO|nr:hypothetical protein [Allobranchiibius huperziae]